MTRLARSGHEQANAKRSRFAATGRLARLIVGIAISAIGVIGGCGEPASSTSSDDEFTMSLSYALAAGQEQHLCQFVQLPESASGEILVSSFSHQFNAGHHWALVRTNVTSVPSGFEQGKPVDCFTSGISAFTGANIVVEQAHTSTTDFPSGMALPFKSGEVLVLQIHGLNTTETAVTDTLTAKLRVASADQVTTRLGMIQFYNPFIYVPALGASKAHDRCKVPSDITIIEATTHFHKRGVDEKVFVDLAGAPPATAPLVESTDWEHPNAWSGSLRVPAGSSIEFSCSYENGDPRPYLQGQDLGENEMCIVFGFYYPALDPAFEGCLPGDEYGTGDKSCSETMNCVQKCPASDWLTPNGTLAFDVGPCFEQCILSSCDSASAPFFKLGDCIQAKCQDECNGGADETCAKCVTEKCGGEFDGCQKHTCP